MQLSVKSGLCVNVEYKCSTWIIKEEFLQHQLNYFFIEVSIANMLTTRNELIKI